MAGAVKMGKRGPAGEAGHGGAGRTGGARLLLVLCAAVALGGAGLAYVWSTLNSLSHGGASPERLVSAVVVGVLVVALVGWLYVYLGRLAPPGPA